MLIQDLQYIENVDLADKVSGKGSLSGNFNLSSGNFSEFQVGITALGKNTGTFAAGEIEILEGIGSSVKIAGGGYAFG